MSSMLDTILANVASNPGAYFFGSGFITLLCYLGHGLVTGTIDLPDDDGGPVSGWGTAGESEG